MQRITILLFVLLNFVIGCVTVQTGSEQSNYSYHYNPAENKLRPQFLVTSENETMVRLYIKLNTRELRYSKANPEVQLRAEVEISYLVVPSFSDRTIIDSSTVVMKIRHNPQQTELVSFFELHTDHLEDYVVYAKVTDKYSNRQSRHFIRGINSKADNRCQYLLKKPNGKPIFAPFITVGDTILINKTYEHTTHLHVHHYEDEFPPAYAPFDTGNTDSIMPGCKPLHRLPFVNYNARFTAEKPGLYRFQSDTSQNGGFLLYVGRKDFPNFTRPEHLAGPLRYITQTNEYDSICAADNKKLEIDKFWLQTTGNKEKARQLIRIWYNRAKYANLFFTSYKEGWKTDRGMVFILFGPPDILNYNDKGEHWVYRNKSSNSHEFLFIKENPKLLRTDYKLRRNLKYAGSWYQAADSWRNGTIYE